MRQEINKKNSNKILKNTRLPKTQSKHQSKQINRGINSQHKSEQAL